MDAFKIVAGSAALVGIGLGTAATLAAPAGDSNLPGLQRGDMSEIAAFTGLASAPTAFLGMTTDTPALFVGASLLVGVAGGAVLGNVIGGIGDARHGA